MARSSGYPIDWTSAGGIEAVRTLTVAIGPREAARRLRLSEAHSAALRQICARGKWLSGGVTAPTPAAVTTPLRLVPMPPAPTATEVLAEVKAPETVTVPVTTASAALAEAHVEHGRRGRIAAARATARALEHVAEQEPATIVKSARALKDLTEASSRAGGWGEDSKTPSVNVNVLNLRFE